MIGLKIILGLVAIGLACIFLYREGLIYKLNSWMREVVFSDQVILFSRRRMAALLILLGGVSFFSGIDTLIEEQTLRPKITAHILENAEQNFREKKYRQSIKRAKELVRNNSRNEAGWIILAQAWWLIGDKEQALRAFDTLKTINPNLSFEAYPVLRFIQKEKLSHQ